MPIFTQPASSIKDPVERHRRIAEDLSLRAHNNYRRADKDEYKEYNEDPYPYSPSEQKRFEKVSDRLHEAAAKHERMAKTASKLKVYGDGHDMKQHGEGKPYGV